jgi:arylsulfatase
MPAYQQRYLAWELHGQRGVRKDKWKLLGLKDHDWMLYNLETDPGETQDLSKLHPDIVGELKGYWAEYARSNNVIEPNKKGKW